MALPKQRSFLSKALAIVALLGTSLIALLSLAGNGGSHHWRLDLTAHFKLQYLVVSLGAFVCFWLWRSCRWQRWLIGLSVFCIVLNGVEVVPWYVPPSIIAPSSAITLRVLHSNVLVRNRDYDSVTALVREVKPDLAVFQEVNARWLEALEAIRDVLPYTYAEPRSAGFGNVIYSALPLQQPSVQFLGQLKYASLATQVSKGGQTLSLLTAHPPPPIRQELFRWRNQLLAAIVPYVRSQTAPVMVIGDLNITMWSPYYKRLEAASGLQNSRVGFGILPSWSPRSWLPWLAIPIDHCLVSPELVVLKTQLGRKVGSDHLPLIVDIAMP
ncbi:endonuclease/exonuclease/phosphatase family protein [Leptolyngbya sp. FACHB-321]|uniref:endonuclease/exonuclease/phosphatase family protein n=1 Tax=Leptolyngbya sp. FACHB-321 TaxID=2692807 RepID=UPI001687C5EE|nr:endonuclease/exonuclease/phosphatase family protein [Leptolyngbya sp. FACHB-321]MBD2034347.1 endonuclease/exonuclease/phosphatase family protein [Leptolyngbya sp. FACHB-321]